MPAEKKPKKANSEKTRNRSSRQREGAARRGRQPAEGVRQAGAPDRRSQRLAQDRDTRRPGRHEGLEVKVLDVRGLTDIADFMVIASGTSDRHVRSVAQRVVEKAKEAGFRPHGVEGQQDGDWVLIDLNEMIVHVMLPRVREFYGLEKLWDHDGHEARRARVDPGACYEMPVDRRRYPAARLGQRGIPRIPEAAAGAAGARAQEIPVATRRAGENPQRAIAARRGRHAGGARPQGSMWLRSRFRRRSA